MSLENAIANRDAILGTVGKAALNVKYPNEFEVYVVALELIDAEGKTLKYFIFPVNPSSLDEKQNRLTNIKKTLSGVVALATTSFVPVDISISGNFGRKFKILLGTDYKDFLSSFNISPDGSVSSGNGSLKTPFDDKIKTGYGCLKVLEQLCEEADLVDEKGPRRLIFYNLAFGTAYLVRPMDFRINMTQETNMIHTYFLSLKALAPLSSLKQGGFSENDRQDLSTTGYVRGQADKALNSLTKILKL